MLKDKISQQLKEAMKARDKVRISTLRLLLNALKNEEIAKLRELTQDEEAAITRRQLKQREEAIEAYEKAGREEAAQKEKQEAEILKEFLPAQIDENQLSELVDQLIGELGALGPGDFGRVMQAVMGKVAGRADGKIVSEVVRKKLG